MNRELVKPHLYPRNRNPQGSKPSIQESDPSPAKDAFALLSVDVRDRLRPRERFFRIGRFGPEAHLRSVVRRSVVRRRSAFRAEPVEPIPASFGASRTTPAAVAAADRRGERSVGSKLPAVGPHESE